MPQFGVAGDGVQDDTAALQSALDAVSVALGVVDVHVPDGVYMINAVSAGQVQTRNNWIGGGLHPKAGTRLHLSPGAVFKVIPNSSPGYACVYIGPEGDGIEVRGGRIEGDRAGHDYASDPTYTSHEWGYGVVTHGARNITVEGVSFAGFTGDAVYIAAVGNLAYPGLYGEYVPSEQITVRNNVIDGSRRNNISIIGCNGVLIEGNVIASAGTDDGVRDGVAPRFGIDIEGNGEGNADFQTPLNVTVRGNRFVGNVAGAVMNFNGYGAVIESNFADGSISIGHSRETAVRSNILKAGSSAASGISSNTGTSYPANAVISGNIIQGFATGILTQRDRVQIADNHVSDFITAGIAVNAAKGVVVSGNNIFDGSGAGSSLSGISVQTGSEAVVERNRVDNCRIGIRVINGADANVRGNTLVRVATALRTQGIDVTVAFADNDVTVGAWSGGSATHDVHSTDSGVDLAVEGNIFRASISYSVNVQSPGGRTRIARNTFLSEYPTQVYLVGGGHQVIGNTFAVARASGSPAAVRLAGGIDKCLVLNNTLYHSGAVAYAALVSIDSGGASNTRVVGNTVVTASASLVTGTDGGLLVEEGNIAVAP
ncbi:right-handed parallel beta-helix repeat-containing protein [Microbacterium profundi]